MGSTYIHIDHGVPDSGIWSFLVRVSWAGLDWLGWLGLGLGGFIPIELNWFGLVWFD